MTRGCPLDVHTGEQVLQIRAGELVRRRRLVEAFLLGAFRRTLTLALADAVQRILAPQTGVQPLQPVLTPDDWPALQTGGPRVEAAELALQRGRVSNRSILPRI